MAASAVDSDIRKPDGLVAFGGMVMGNGGLDPDNDTNTVEGRMRSSSLPGYQSPDSKAKKKTFISSLRRKFSRNSARRSSQQQSATSSADDGLKSPLATSTNCYTESGKMADSEVTAGSEVDGGASLAEENGCVEEEEAGGRADPALASSAPASAALCSASDVGEASIRERPPLAGPKPMPCTMPPLHALGMADPPPPLEMSPASTSAAMSTSHSADDNRHSPPRPQNRPNFEDNVYENTAALVNAFGPMRDVGRWYSVYHQQRRYSTSGSDYDSSPGAARANGFLEYSRRGPAQLPSTPGEQVLLVEEGDTGVYETLPPSVGMDGDPEASLTSNVRELAQYSWYWGPVSRQEAENLLADQRDGTFLVRDSSDERYLLSLTFRSLGRTLHTRIEHHLGRFSFFPINSANYDDGYSSIDQLIERSMYDSQDGAFCFSRQRIENAPSIPVRLTAPFSRRSVVRSLQHCCRFVIRQHTRYDLIQHLPLPNMVKEYLKKNRF